MRDQATPRATLHRRDRERRHVRQAQPAAVGSRPEVTRLFDPTSSLLFTFSIEQRSHVKVVNCGILFRQTAGDRDADLRWQLAEFPGGERAEPREHHLTARLSSRVGAGAAAGAACAAAPLRRVLRARVSHRTLHSPCATYSSALCELWTID